MAPVGDGRQWLSQANPSQSCCNLCAPPSLQHSSDTLWGLLCQAADAHCRFGRMRFRKFLLQSLFISPTAVPGVCQCMLQQRSWCPCKAGRSLWEMCKGCHCSLHGAKRCQLHFLRRSWLGLPPATGVCAPGQTASPCVLEPGDSIEAFQSLPPTLRDR